MSGTFSNDKNMLKMVGTLSAGGIASFVTQPFQVLKTNMINRPSIYLKDLHVQITSRGWSQYMRGAPLAVMRQSYGFAIYTSMISMLNSNIESVLPMLNKYYKYSIAAVLGKSTAMLFQAPLTLLKTRREVLSSESLSQEVKFFFENPFQQLTKGFGSTLAREASYSLIHYNTFRFIKDDVLLQQFDIDSTFLPAFVSGIFAITLSQPFQVVRSKISLDTSVSRVSIMNCLKDQVRATGWKGLFVGFFPRLLRKPINSGVSWTVLEFLKPSLQQ